MAQVEGSAEYFVIYEVIGTSGRCREEAKKPLGALLEPSWSPLGAVRGDKMFHKRKKKERNKKRQEQKRKNKTNNT